MASTDAIGTAAWRPAPTFLTRRLRVDELGLDPDLRGLDQLHDQPIGAGRGEVGEGAVAVGAETVGALDGCETAGQYGRDGGRVVGHVLADVVHSRAVLAQVVGEDARAADGLDQLELHLALPRQRVPELELDALAEVRHVLQDVRPETPGRPRPDAQPLVPGLDRGVQVIDHERDLLEGGIEERGQIGHGYSPNCASSSAWADRRVPAATSPMATARPCSSDSASAPPPATAPRPPAPPPPTGLPARTACAKSSSSMAMLAASTYSGGRSYSVPSGPNRAAVMPSSA